MAPWQQQVMQQSNAMMAQGQMQGTQMVTFQAGTGTSTTAWWSSNTSTTTSAATVQIYGGGGGGSGGTIYGNQAGFISSAKAILYKDTDYELPDGSVLKIDGKGNFKVTQKPDKVIYQQCFVREFNRYLNASDLLEQFIEDLGSMGVTQQDMLRVPIEAFINWLIISAAKKDGDSLEGLPSVHSALLTHQQKETLPCPTEKVTSPTASPR